MNTGEYLGKLIVNAREEKGWSQQRLADEMGADIRTIQKAESGTSNPLMETVLKYIFLLNISPAILSEHDANEEGLRLDRIYRELLSFSPEQIELVCKSALHLSRWRERHPGTETLSDYYKVLTETDMQSKEK